MTLSKTTLALLALSALAPAQIPSVATPESVFGFRPGADDRLNSWAELKRFYEALDRTSDRVRVENLGKTTEGRPYLVAVISSPDTIRNLKKAQEANARLSDPRKLKGGDAEAEALITAGKAVVVITCGVHSNEVASYLGGQLIAYRLASATDAETTRILDNTIVVLVPSLNPDGVDIVKGQFEATLRGEARPAGLPQPLYHRYIGHDDNRDWVGFTQKETQISVEKVINPWHPQVLHDIHQQGSAGPRITLPPYTLPVEPNIPKQLVKGYTDLGLGMLADLTAKGYAGAIAGAEGAQGYDAWSPLRQYAHFHNAVRMLSETASARIASPITVDPARVRPNAPLPNAPLPWKGGVWRVGDATSYVSAAAFSLLGLVANDRERWLRTAYEIAKESVRPRGAGETAAWLLPPSPNRAPLLTILNSGGVEIETLREPLQKNGAEYPRGTAVVRLDQPFGGFANAVLSVQKYPDLLDAAGRPVRPYDVTAHTLPLLLDTPAIPIEGPFDAKGRRERRVRREPVRVRGKAVEGVRLALLRSNTIGEGWTRWVLEQNRVPYTLIDPSELRRDDLGQRFDALLLPTSPFGGGRRGGEEAEDASAPQEESGGVAERVKAFVEGGGTVIALNRASASLIGPLGLPLRDVTQGLGRNDFYVPGSILQADLDLAHPLARGGRPRSILWAEGSPAFETTATNPSVRVDVVARYPQEANPLLSGWLLGGDRIKGKAALVEAHLGKGRVVLFGFEPNYRGLSLATYPLLFNAIQSARRS